MIRQLTFTSRRLCLLFLASAPLCLPAVAQGPQPIEFRIAKGKANELVGAQIDAISDQRELDKISTDRVPTFWTKLLPAYFGEEKVEISRRKSLERFDALYKDCGYSVAEVGADVNGYVLRVNSPTTRQLCGSFALAGLIGGPYRVPTDEVWRVVREIRESDTPVPVTNAKQWDVVVWLNSADKADHFALVYEPLGQDVRIITKNLHEKIYIGLLSRFPADMFPGTKARIFHVDWRTVDAWRLDEESDKEKAVPVPDGKVDRGQPPLGRPRVWKTVIEAANRMNKELALPPYQPKLFNVVKVSTPSVAWEFDDGKAHVQGELVCLDPSPPFKQAEEIARVWLGRKTFGAGSVQPLGILDVIGWRHGPFSDGAWSGQCALGRTFGRYLLLASFRIRSTETKLANDPQWLNNAKARASQLAEGAMKTLVACASANGLNKPERPIANYP